MGTLNLKEYKIDTIHGATALIAGSETMLSEGGDFDKIRSMKRK